MPFHPAEFCQCRPRANRRQSHTGDKADGPHRYTRLPQPIFRQPSRTNSSAIGQDGIEANGNDLLCTMTGSSGDLSEILPTDSLRLQSLQTPVEEVAALALAQRLDLRADELRTRAAAAGVRAAQASRLPRIDAFARLQLDADELLERQGESWSIGTKATWDLFSGFHHEGAVGQAKAGKTRSDAMRDHRLEQVQLEARRAHRDVTAARARYDVTTGATAASRERLRLTTRACPLWPSCSTPKLT